jgi:hypothetical protein
VHYVSKDEVQLMIEAAITRHNRNASMISMCLGIVFLALFVDGFLRVLGMVPPFLGIDVSIMSELEHRTIQSILDKIQN